VFQWRCGVATNSGVQVTSLHYFGGVTTDGMLTWWRGE